MSAYNLGESLLPPHPIEAKRLANIPEGWKAMAVIGERELFEPTQSNKTKAEQYDEAYGAKNWGIVRHEMSDGAETQLIDVIALVVDQTDLEAHEITIDTTESETYQIPVQLGKSAVQNTQEQ